MLDCLQALRMTLTPFILFLLCIRFNDRLIAIKFYYCFCCCCVWGLFHLLIFCATSSNPMAYARFGFVHLLLLMLLLLPLSLLLLLMHNNNNNSTKLNNNNPFNDNSTTKCVMHKSPFHTYWLSCIYEYMCAIVCLCVYVCAIVCLCVCAFGFILCALCSSDEDIKISVRNIVRILLWSFQNNNKTMFQFCRVHWCMNQMKWNIGLTLLHWISFHFFLQL